jgi:hypothetical protein
MTSRRPGLVCAMVVLVTATGCSGSSDAATGDASPSASATSSPRSPATDGTSATIAIPGGRHVQDGAAAFDLPPDVAFTEAPVRTEEGAYERTWRYAPDPSSALCVVTLVQQPQYTKPFPDNERQLYRARVEQLEGGKVLVDEAGPGPSGSAAGWLTHHVSPPNTAAGKTKAASVWTRTFLTPDKGLVQLAAAATEDSAETCRTDAIVRSLAFTGNEVAPAPTGPTSPSVTSRTATGSGA